MEREWERCLSSPPAHRDQLVVSSMGASVGVGRGKEGRSGGLIFAILEVGWLQENVPPGFQEMLWPADTGIRAGELRTHSNSCPSRPDYALPTLTLHACTLSVDR